MDADKLIQRLMATFIDELEEHVRALSRDLLALEKDSTAGARAERIKALFRTAHSLKGASRAVNLELLESGAHRMESILADARDGHKALNAEAIESLLALTDKIGDAGSRLRAGLTLQNSPLEKFLIQHESAPVAEPQPPPPTVEAAPEIHDEETALQSGLKSVLAGPQGNMTVRVPAQKLDTLLAASGELLVARRALESRTDSLQTLQEFVRRWNVEWRRSERQILKLVQDADTENPAAARLPERVTQAVNQNRENLFRLDKELEKFAGAMQQELRPLDQAASRVDQEVYRFRMLPFLTACQGFDRAVRDLAKASGKDVELRIEGGEVELDRSMLEALKDPLMHLIRNAVDHGVESVAQRRSMGKIPQGRVVISASLHGSRVEIGVEDDGQGLNLAAIRAQARRKKMLEPADDEDLAKLIFLPGFSTASLITEVSGRGVGLDVVKAKVEALHGSVEVSFKPGRGVRFVLAVPLTLTTMQALLVQVCGQVFALAATHVVRLRRAGAGEIQSIEGREVVMVDGAPVPVASLAETLGIPATDLRQTRQKALLVVVQADGNKVAFVVDELLASQEILIKNLGPRLPSVRHVSGATLLSTGHAALILNAAELIRAALRRPQQRNLADAFAKNQPLIKKKVLVADDSVTTRSLEKSILEAAGYDVMAAVDGADAWDLLQKFGADLVISDVEMPRLDGFGLTEVIRKSKRFRDVPVVLLTALESEQDKARGIDVGADAYLGKSAFDHRNLLETVAQLL